MLFAGQGMWRGEMEVIRPRSIAPIDCDHRHKIDYAAKTGVMIRRTANELQMREVREQLRAGADLTDLNWTELVNIEPLEIDQGEPIVKEIEAFLDAVRTGNRPAIDATAGFVNVRTAERIVEAIKHSLGATTSAALG